MMHLTMLLQAHLPRFIEAIWHLLVSIGPDVKHDGVCMHTVSGSMSLILVSLQVLR